MLTINQIDTEFKPFLGLKWGLDVNIGISQCKVDQPWSNLTDNVDQEG